MKHSASGGVCMNKSVTWAVGPAAVRGHVIRTAVTHRLATLLAQLTAAAQALPRSYFKDLARPMQAAWMSLNSCDELVSLTLPWDAIVSEYNFDSDAVLPEKSTGGCVQQQATASETHLVRQHPDIVVFHKQRVVAEDGDEVGAATWNDVVQLCVASRLSGESLFIACADPILRGCVLTIVSGSAVESMEETSGDLRDALLWFGSHSLRCHVAQVVQRRVAATVAAVVSFRRRLLDLSMTFFFELLLHSAPPDDALVEMLRIAQMPIRTSVDADEFLRPPSFRAPSPPQRPHSTLLRDNVRSLGMQGCPGIRATTTFEFVQASIEQLDSTACLLFVMSGALLTVAGHSDVERDEVIVQISASMREENRCAHTDTCFGNLRFTFFRKKPAADPHASVPGLTDVYLEVTSCPCSRSDPQVTSALLIDCAPFGDTEVSDNGGSRTRDSVSGTRSPIPPCLPTPKGSASLESEGMRVFAAELAARLELIRFASDEARISSVATRVGRFSSLSCGSNDGPDSFPRSFHPEEAEEEGPPTESARLPLALWGFKLRTFAAVLKPSCGSGELWSEIVRETPLLWTFDQPLIWNIMRIVPRKLADRQRSLASVVTLPKVHLVVSEMDGGNGLTDEQHNAAIVEERKTLLQWVRRAASECSGSLVALVQRLGAETMVAAVSLDLVEEFGTGDELVFTINLLVDRPHRSGVPPLSALSGVRVLEHPLLSGPSHAPVVLMIDLDRTLCDTSLSYDQAASAGLVESAVVTYAVGPSLRRERVFVRPGATELLKAVRSARLFSSSAPTIGAGVIPVLVTKSSTLRARAILNALLDRDGDTFADVVAVEALRSMSTGTAAATPTSGVEKSIAAVLKHCRLPTDATVAVLDDAPEDWRKADWRSVVAVTRFSDGRFDSPDTLWASNSLTPPRKSQRALSSSPPLVLTRIAERVAKLTLRKLQAKMREQSESSEEPVRPLGTATDDDDVPWAQLHAVPAVVEEEEEEEYVRGGSLGVTWATGSPATPRRSRFDDGDVEDVEVLAVSPAYSAPRSPST